MKKILIKKKKKHSSPPCREWEPRSHAWIPSIITAIPQDCDEVFFNKTKYRLNNEKILMKKKKSACSSPPPSLQNCDGISNTLF